MLYKYGLAKSPTFKRLYFYLHTVKLLFFVDNVLIQIFCLFSVGLFVLLPFESSLYILDTSSLLGHKLWKYFPHLWLCYLSLNNIF